MKTHSEARDNISDLPLPSTQSTAWGPEALALRNRRNREHQSIRPRGGELQARGPGTIELIFSGIRPRPWQPQLASLAASRSEWIRRNAYYYACVRRLLRHLVEPGKRVLNIRCQTGFLLDSLEPGYGVGIEISAEMVEVARATHPRFQYEEALPENYVPREKFDYILLCDIGDTVDVQQTLQRLLAACDRHTRLIIYSYNDVWELILRLGQRLGLKIPQTEQNWLSERDVIGLLKLSGFEWLTTHRTAFFPKYIPLLSAFLNRFVAKLPGIERLSMVEVLVARPVQKPISAAEISVSVIVPCKDERGNVESAVRRIPELGRSTEIIFCDDKSTDGTAAEVRRLQEQYPERRIRLVDGPGICKAKNVQAGFEAATGDILAILDADLTVMPEELPWFIDSLTGGRAEFVNGSRLVYPIPRDAMKNTNLIGNKVFSGLFSFLLGQPIKDTLCGTKVLWRTDWERIRPMIGTWGTMDRWGDYDLLFGAAKLNLRILDQPVHYQERVYGITKMTRVFKNGLVMLRMCGHALRKLKMGY